QIKLEDVRLELKDQNRITSIKASQSISDSIVMDMPDMQTIINSASIFTHTINQAKINQDLKPAKQKALDNGDIYLQVPTHIPTSQRPKNLQ
ncbi:9434_t:CDS:2, partial [Gigaspora margarita]